MESIAARCTQRATSGTTAGSFAGAVVAGLARWIIPSSVAAAGIGFALANGMQYGRSNHWQYLLHGLHAADPSFLRSDWFTTRTEAHHRLFNGLVSLAASTGRPEVVLGLLNGACALAFAFSLYFMVARFSRRPLLGYALAIALAAGLPIDGLGDSNILLPYFVPSVFSGVVLFAAVTCLLYSRDAVAGLLAAAAGAMHGNYLLLIGPLWLLVLLLDGRGWTRRRAAWLLGPWAVAWIPHVAYFIAMLRDPASRVEARHIFWDVYAPFHYRPLTWNWREYAAFGLIVTSGVIAAVVGRVRLGRTARAVVSAFALILTMGAVGTIGWPNDFVTSLFTWRFAPFVAVFAIISISLAVTEEWGSPARRLALAAFLAAMMRLARLPDAACASILVAAALALACDGWVHSANARRTWISGSIGVIAAILVAAVLARQGLWRRDMFGRAYKPAEESLFAWCRQSTDTDALFIIPPNLAPFRLEARRGVLVDWKCMPLLPHDQIEWMRRQERLAGRKINCEADATSGYAEMDSARASLLARDFGCRYVIVDRKLGGSPLLPLRQRYSNDRFDVYEADARIAAIRR